MPERRPLLKPRTSSFKLGRPAANRRPQLGSQQPARMGGKERERELPPATDDEDATQATTQEGCWRRGGVIRQSQPTAQHHQITAGLASSAKRRAAAMSQGSGRRNEWPTSSDAAVSSVRARSHSQHRSLPGVTCDYFDEALLKPRANDVRRATPPSALARARDPSDAFHPRPHQPNPSPEAR